MPSFGGGGGGQVSPAVYSQGGNPAPFIPTGQGMADQNYQSLMQGLMSPTMQALSNIGQLPASTYWPAAQTIAGWQTNSPEEGWAQQAAGLGMNYGQAAGMLGYNAGMNTFPYLAGNVTSQVPALWSAGNQILGTAFDPQQALYNQQSQQNQAQVNAQNAMSGLSGTPYGANLANLANQNFNTNWQNQLLGRQATGLGAANQAFQGANQAEALSGQLLGQGAGLAGQGAQAVYDAGQLPLQQLNQYSNSGLSAIMNLLNIGNQPFQFAESLFSPLGNYMQLGQDASKLALQGGQMGFQQNQASGAGLMGLLGGIARMLPGVGGLLGGVSNLFGGAPSDPGGSWSSAEGPGW